MNKPAPCKDDLPRLADAELAACLAALAHPARIAILRHLARADSCCCGEVVGHLELAQSTVSQHLKVLVSAGLVRFETEGQRSCYALNRPALKEAADELACFAIACC